MFSFLMSMPIIAAASMLKVPHVLKSERRRACRCSSASWRRRSAGGSRSLCCCASSCAQLRHLRACIAVVLGLIVLAIAYGR